MNQQKLKSDLFDCLTDHSRTFKNFLCSVRYSSDGDWALLAFESERPIKGPNDRPRIPSQHMKTL